ncbi:MAG: hypothetical protein WBB27_17445, partial [Maribacter sp.]
MKNVLFLCLTSLILNAQTSKLLGYDTNGMLTYVEDAKGNRIPDYSYVGYNHGERPIPQIKSKITLNAIDGNNLNRLQQAINQLEASQPDENGFRGALFLKSGTYNVEGILKIKKSGIVIRGEGKSTILIATKKMKSDFVVFEGLSDPKKIASSKTKIMDSYV